MTKQLVDGALLKQMLRNGANNLQNRYQEIDALNVFPVPDGDTGTNMSLTFQAGVKEACDLASNHVGEITKKLSRGLLMGARGNSGVILSQIFRGFAQGVEGLAEINSLQMAQAFQKGTEIAYRAVMRPVEGTILTVIRESSYMALKYVQENPECDIFQYFKQFLAEARDSLEFTPELLAVLKEVGVVDSGGAGLIVILEGFLAALEDQVIELAQVHEMEVNHVQSQIAHDEFGYCTEFIVRLAENEFLKFEEAHLRSSLEKLGDSIVVVQDEDLVKVHVHTLKPGDALNLAQRYGEFIKLKIENMQEQHEHLMMEIPKHEHSETKTIKEQQDFAIITVAAGKGLSDYFKSIRADVVINGGQTMNPSTEDFVAAIKSVNAKHIIILPNNSNIILAAQQAQAVLEELDISVLATKSIPQGIGALVMFNPAADLATNLADMEAGRKLVKTGQVTTAIKDTSFEQVQIKEGEYIGIADKSIVVSDADLYTASLELLKSLVSEDAELVTLIQGAEGNVEVTAALEDVLTNEFSVEVEVILGDQPVYQYYFGVE